VAEDAERFDTAKEAAGGWFRALAPVPERGAQRAEARHLAVAEEVYATTIVVIATSVSRHLTCSRSMRCCWQSTSGFLRKFGAA